MKVSFAYFANLVTLLHRLIPSFTSRWLILQCLLLVILLHAGPWPWASRTLSMLAALIPAWRLLLHAGWQEHELLAGSLMTVTVAVLGVVLANIVTPLGADQGSQVFAYKAYAWTYVAAQCMLALSWYAWWRSGGPWPALGGGFLAALGAVMSAKAHGSRPISDVLEMQPWTYMWGGDHGPIDVLSRVAPKLLAVEILGLGGVTVVLAVAAWRRS